LTVTPAVDTRTGITGQTLTYTLRITNSGFMTDVVNFSAVSRTWPTVLPSALSLPPGGSAAAIVSVTVPVTAVIGRAERITVTAQSTGDATRVNTVLTTHFNQHSLSASQAQFGNPGQVLTYPLILMNTGSLTDSFALSLSGQTWPTSLSTVSATLPPAANMIVTAQVTIPVTAFADQIDFAHVQAQSSNSGLTSGVNLTSTVDLVYSSTLAPTNVSSAGLPGQVVTYPFQLRNTGSFTQTFAVDGHSSWPLTIAPSMIGPLLPGKSANFTVTTSIPVTATTSAQATITATARDSLLEPLIAYITTDSSLVHGVSVTAQPTTQAATPGSSATYAISVTNTGNVQEVFALELLTSGWPISVSPASLLVPSGATQAAHLTVTVPSQTLANTADVARLAGWSSGREVSATLSVTTTANTVYGVTLAPSSMSAVVRRGEAITYTLRLTNTGNITTSFQLASLGAWAAPISPTILGPLAALAGRDFQVRVQVPPSATGSVTTVVTATAQGGSLPFTTASLITTVKQYRLYLPLVRRS
jgi:uncharacterized membrane protein